MRKTGSRVMLQVVDKNLARCHYILSYRRMTQLFRTRGNVERGAVRSTFTLRLFLLVVVIGTIAPLAYAAFSQAYSRYVEISPPEIELLEVPRGLSTASTTLRFRLLDHDAGLDEVVVRARQRGRIKELLKVKLKGVSRSEHQIVFEDSKNHFQEGAVEIEIAAFDRAFWSNRGQKDLKLAVDYRKPKVEVLTTQHNARRGGSQLVFYRAFDEEVALSGVRVGEKVFKGFRAQGLDSSFEDPNLYVAFYAIDIAQDVSNLSVRVFAEDVVGNSVSTDFYNKVLDRPRRSLTLGLTDAFLRTNVKPLFEQNARHLANEESHGAVLGEESDPPELREFAVLNEQVKPADLRETRDFLEKNQRFESFLKQYFLRQAGTTRVSFADQVSYSWNGQIITSDVSSGTEYSLPAGQQDILAVNEGIVSIVRHQGTYGRMVVIDHGLGVASLYAHLSDTKVSAGSLVKRGEVIGTVGSSGLAIRPNAWFEMRVHGVAVDPAEWWDAGWFNQHVVAKIDDMKRQFGIITSRPLSSGGLP